MTNSSTQNNRHTLPAGDIHREKEETMKNYIVRLRNYRGAIIDGEFYSNTTAELAELMYKSRCQRLGIAIVESAGDFITVEETDLLK